MSDHVDYVSLISGLPNPERLFLAKLPPLSRIKLEKRLKVLTEHDLETLYAIESVLDWRLQSKDHIEEDVIANAFRVYRSLQSDTLKTILRDKLELRTCIAALRHRELGNSPPNHSHWGFGRWVSHISRHWSETHFKLEKVFPWLIPAYQLMQKNDAAGLERLILELTFRQLQRAAGEHFFDFEAVVIYVLKWNVIDRSTRHNSAAAKHRFNQLVEQGLGNRTQNLFKEAV